MINPDARVKVCLKCRFFSLVKFSGFLTCNLIGQYVCVGKLCMMWMTPQLKMKYRPDGKFYSIPSGRTRAPPEAICSSRHISTGLSRLLFQPVKQENVAILKVALVSCKFITS